MASTIIPLVLSGGAGTRLWPLSRGAAPKQFLKLNGNATLLEQTLGRCRAALFDARPILVGAADNRGQLLETVTGLGISADTVLEPMRRNSCAAIVAGTLRALERDAEAVVLVLAADHHIPDAAAFQRAAAEALPAARAGWIVTFGVTPRHPATGYGYISPGEDTGLAPVRHVARFVEKPDAATARRYMAESYLWNSGNFLFSAAHFIAIARTLVPQVVEAVEQALQKARRDEDFIRLDADAFATAPQISVDYAIMEKTNRAAVLPVSYLWSDIGTWDAVAASVNPDNAGNALVGRGLILNSNNVMVHSDHLLTTVVGCDDLVVITTADAVMVVRKDHSEDVKLLVERLRQAGFAEWEKSTV